MEKENVPNDILLTESQEREILERDSNFIEGRTSARDWTEIKENLEELFCSF